MYSHASHGQVSLQMFELHGDQHRDLLAGPFGLVEAVEPRSH